MAQVSVHPNSWPQASPSNGIHWGSVILGCLSVVAGFLCLIYTFLASLVSATFFGAVLIVLGISFFGYAFGYRKWYQVLGHALIGALWILGGLAMVFFPVAGLISLTLLIAMLLCAAGFFKILVATFQRYRRWGWTVLSGIASLALAGIILWQWPISAAYIPGVLLGADLIVHGVAVIVFSFGLRSHSVI